MDELIAFLRARLDEIETAAKGAQETYSPSNDVVGPLVGPCLRIPAAGPWLIIDPAKLLAEVQAKRAILDDYDALTGAGDPFAFAGKREGLVALEQVIRHLGAVFQDHPDYRFEEWRP